MKVPIRVKYWAGLLGYRAQHRTRYVSLHTAQLAAIRLEIDLDGP